MSLPTEHGVINPFTLSLSTRYNVTTGCPSPPNFCRWVIIMIISRYGNYQNRPTVHFRSRNCCLEIPLVLDTHVCACRCAQACHYRCVCFTWEKQTSFFQIWAPQRLVYSERGLHLPECLLDKQIFKYKQYWKDCFKHWSIKQHLRV